MSFWFLDASVFLAREDAEDDQHEAARELFAGEATLATLDLAFYEVANVAVRAWDDPGAADRMRRLISAVADDGGLIRVDDNLATRATQIADKDGISAYDSGYVAGAASIGATLVSCDLRDLVNRNLAITPRQACEPAAGAP